ncbi:NAD-dependent epimerase/dehydratase family protein [Chromobacterium alticapitis]|uniref:dTDP-glucose 4,6-dehydratase n=1 Tax=Chromobacterium alticapitis TaxID=2073169 RepID=A0A2S5DJQ9_9NEIS|nr:NAD(P)-dependent oxidoreductase [Chromobacterium alticapitis]POZ63232.1 dTDP-glucose 4,6-dehydratase [Chromobacterium alticapitis]
MSQKVFVAGSSGVIGKALIPLLLDAGYTVYGGTHRPEHVEALKALGVTPVLANVYDAEALKDELVRIQPWAVIHQLTDLPRGLDPSLMAQAVVNNARIRDEGTRNLVAAAVAAGASRIVAQSIAWAYKAGDKPYLETHPLDLDAEGTRRTSVHGVAALEKHVLGEAKLQGTVLRYGQLYGPNTGTDQPTGASPLHVEAAAHAALLALQKSPGGVFNITEDNPDVNSEKAKSVLGWSPALRLAAAAV